MWRTIAPSGRDGSLRGRYKAIPYVSESHLLIEAQFRVASLNHAQSILKVATENVSLKEREKIGQAVSSVDKTPPFDRGSINTHPQRSACPPPVRL